VYNGYSARSIADAGEVLMSTPDVWFGCLWSRVVGRTVRARQRGTMLVERAEGGLVPMALMATTSKR
jgi:hypothetical protein